VAPGQDYGSAVLSNLWYRVAAQHGAAGLHPGLGNTRASIFSGSGVGIPGRMSKRKYCRVSERDAMMHIKSLAASRNCRPPGFWDCCLLFSARAAFPYSVSHPRGDYRLQPGIVRSNAALEAIPGLHEDELTQAHAYRLWRLHHSDLGLLSLFGASSFQRSQPDYVRRRLSSSSNP